MSNLSRLQAFLESDEPTTVVAPSAAAQPINYGERFLMNFSKTVQKATVAALLVAQVAGAAAGAAPPDMSDAQVHANRPAATQTSDDFTVSAASAMFKINQRDAGQPLTKEVTGLINHVRGLYARYAGDGKTAVETAIHAVRADEAVEFGLPLALYGAPKHSAGAAGDYKCVVLEMRSDYKTAMEATQADPVYADAALRAFYMAHEDMHCRTASYLGKLRYWEPPAEGEVKTADDLAQHFTALLGESVADARAVLIVAHRDGTRAASSLLDKLDYVRGKDAAADPGHDSRDTLALVRQAINNDPARFATPGATFQAAIEFGFQGALETFHKQTSSTDHLAMATPTFQAAVEFNARGLAQAAHDYTHGKHDPAKTQVWAYGYGLETGSVAGPTAVARTGNVDPFADASDGVPDVAAIKAATGRAQQTLVARLEAQSPLRQAAAGPEGPDPAARQQGSAGLRGPSSGFLQTLKAPAVHSHSHNHKFHKPH